MKKLILILLLPVVMIVMGGCDAGSLSRIAAAAAQELPFVGEWLFGGEVALSVDEQVRQYVDPLLEEIAKWAVPQGDDLLMFFEFVGPETVWPGRNESRYERDGVQAILSADGEFVILWDEPVTYVLEPPCVCEHQGKGHCKHEQNGHVDDCCGC